MKKIKLYIVQANDGESLILQYVTYPTPINILIDGGYKKTFTKHLKSIFYEGFLAPTLNLVIASHSDNDHIEGLVTLIDDTLQKQDANINERYIIKIDNLWHNTFSLTEEEEASIRPGLEQVPNKFITQELISIQEGENLRKKAEKVPIKINSHFPNDHVCFKNDPIQITEDLKIYVIGPSQRNLEALRKNWQDWYDKQKNQPSAKVDQSPFNRSSIMVLVEAKVRNSTKKLLFTGDGRSDDIIDGLTRIDMIESGETLDLDVLKIPHHGSEKNVDNSFFNMIRAKYYVISGKGKHPSKQTLDWINESAPESSEIIITNNNDAVTLFRRENPKRIIREIPPNKSFYSLKI